MTDTTSTKTYFVLIEPVFSQGVGDYCMITNDITKIDLLRNQLFSFKNYVANKSIDEMDYWEFYEYVDCLTEITFCKNEYIYFGYNLHYNCYNGNFDKLLKINWKDNKTPLKNSKIYNYNEKMELDVVYNNVYYPPIKTNIDEFDILTNGKK